MVDGFALHIIPLDRIANRIAEATRGLNLSEDIFAGLDLSLRGGWTVYREYFHVGKARRTGTEMGRRKCLELVSAKSDEHLAVPGQRYGLHERLVLLCQSLYGQCRTGGAVFNFDALPGWYSMIFLSKPNTTRPSHDSGCVWGCTWSCLNCWAFSTPTSAST